MSDIELSPEHKMALAAIALLTPALGGALGGRQGALMGASAGAKAAGTGLGEITEAQMKEDEKAQAAKLAEAKYERERKDRKTDAIEIDKAKKENTPVKPKEPKTRAVTTIGPDGKPVVKIVADEIGAEIPGYVKPDKPAKDITVSERNTLQTQYDKDLGVRKNRAVIESYQDAQALVKDPSPASDQALIFAYMKALDPSSVVRESEAESAQALGGLVERAKAKLKQMGGESGLTDSQRKDLVSQIKKLAKTAAERQKGVDDQFRGLASRRNVSNEDLRFMALPEFEPDQTSAPAYKPGDVVEVGGKKHRVGDDGDTLIPIEEGK